MTVTSVMGVGEAAAESRPQGKGSGLGDGDVLERSLSCGRVERNSTEVGRDWGGEVLEGGRKLDWDG